MTQIDIEISRYQANLASAIERKLPEGVIEQYRQYIRRKTEEKAKLEQQLSGNVETSFIAKAS